MKTILLALDLNNFSADMIEYTLDLAKATKARIYAFHVVEDIDFFIGHNEGPEYVHIDLAKEVREEHKFLQRLAALVRAQGGVEAEALLVNGEVVSNLLEHASRLDADLVVVGTNEHGFLANALGGNTTIELIKRAGVPVLAYPLKKNIL